MPRAALPASPDGLRIDPGRLRRDIEAVNALGRVAGLPGIHRISFSDADMAGRRWLLQRLTEAGLEAWMDAVGNVLGRWPAGSGRAVLVGSHLDTVPNGGPFDGTLGVCAALEAVRALRASGLRPVRPIMVVCTADEEGRFGGMLGSEALCGLLPPGWIDRAVADDGTRLRDAMQRRGLRPDDATQAALDPDTVALFLELHVEQGPILAETGVPIGIVTGASGCFNWTITMQGVANHSGTTPMDRRRDAMRGLAAFVDRLDAVIAAAGGPETRLTVGHVALEPNFPHSIAGRAVFSLIGRDPDATVMRRVADRCRAVSAETCRTHGLGLEIVEASWLEPRALDGFIADAVAETADRLNIRHRRLVSGAGHDAQTFARVFPAGLIFAPSVGGISHAPEEWTEWADIERAANLLTHAVARFASAPAHDPPRAGASDGRPPPR